MSEMFLYPRLNSNLMDSIELNISEAEFYFDMDENEQKININYDNPSKIELVDSDNSWNKNLDNLKIKQKIILGNCSSLFGTGGVTNEQSILGIAILSSSRESKTRQVKKVSTFKLEDKTHECSFVLDFPRGSYRKKIEYSIIVYVHRLNGAAGIFADGTGYVLGSIFDTTLLLEGESSIFPIRSIEDKDAPFWRLQCDWQDLNDSFEENTSLILNKLHKDYRFIDPLDAKYDEELFKEILMEVLTQMIFYAKELGELSILFEEEWVPGSIGDLLIYYINTFSINYSTVATIYSSITKGMRGWYAIQNIK